MPPSLQGQGWQDLARQLSVTSGAWAAANWFDNRVQGAEPTVRERRTEKRYRTFTEHLLHVWPCPKYFMWAHHLLDNLKREIAFFFF